MPATSALSLALVFAVATAPLPVPRPALPGADGPHPPRGAAPLMPLPIPRPKRFPTRPGLADQSGPPDPIAPSAEPQVGHAASASMLCRDPRLKGRSVPTILDPVQACGVLAPVKVEEIAGIRLSSPATLDCETARRTANLFESIARPAAREHLGADIKTVWVMGSYVCRTRNSQPGRRISEHGLGRAIDIGGVTLSDGRRLTVESDWGKGRKGTFLATLRNRACGLFSTVLGPGSDRFHDDHFHFDTAPRRGEPYCK